MPPVDWGSLAQRGADLYELYPPAVAAATISTLSSVARDEPAMTADMLAVLPQGARLHALEFRMKSPISLAAKIASRVESAAALVSVDEVQGEVTDLVRYTVVAPSSADVASNARASLEALVERGWEVRELEHSFVEGSPYKGLHAIVRHEASGRDVEVQFHSERAIALKDVCHVEYETMRDPSRGGEERLAAFDSMAASWADVDAPPGVDSLEVGGVRVRAKHYRRPAIQSKME